MSNTRKNVFSALSKEVQEQVNILEAISNSYHCVLSTLSNDL